MSANKSQMLWEQLLDIGQQMNETRALEPLLVFALDVSIDLLGALYGFIVLVDEQGQLDFAVARDRHGNNVDNPSMQVSHTIIFRVMEEKEHLIRASAVTDDDFQSVESVSVLNLKSVLCVPLIAMGTVIGVIYLENRTESGLFSEDDAIPLRYLAGHAAVCIQNALIVEELDQVRNDRITKLTETTDDLNDAAREAINRVVEEERTRLLYGFIQDTSHQFRTPLSVIKMNVDLLARKVDLTVAANYLDRIRHQIDVIVELVDSLNLLAKLDTHFERVMTDENLYHVVLDMWEIMAQRASMRQIHFERPQGDDLVRVPLMQDYALQAIGKVLANAIQYTQGGGEITVTVRETETTGEIIISDTGIGIAPDNLPHVKKRFYQVDKSGTMRGLGLGLAIADSIMKAHDGAVIIESVLGQGTTVTLVFSKTKR